MRHRSLMTLLRGFLLGLFVLGGPGLPLIDAVAWHGSATQRAASTRLDATGAARTHADVCSLAAPLPVPGPVPCAAAPMPAIKLAARVPSALRRPFRIAIIPENSARPRAPPILSA